MKKWEAPKLIVLVRTSAAESVLAACKGGSYYTSSQSDTRACAHGTGQFCMYCTDSATS
jgi:hypothetical protein